MQNKHPIPNEIPESSSFDRSMRKIGIVPLIDRYLHKRRKRKFKLALGNPSSKKELAKIMLDLRDSSPKQLAPQAVPTKVFEWTLLATIVGTFILLIVSPSNFLYNILVVPVLPLFFGISLGSLFSRLFKKRRHASGPKLQFAKEFASEVFREETHENLKLVLSMLLQHSQKDIQVVGFDFMVQWGAPWTLPLLQQQLARWQSEQLLPPNELSFLESHLEIFRARLESADPISGYGFDKLAHHHEYWTRLNLASFQEEQHALLKYIDVDLKEDDPEQFYVRRQRAGMWFPQVVCDKCHVHAQEFKLSGQQSEVKCPVCSSNAHLLMPIREIIGYIGRPHISPPERSVSYDVWDPASKTVAYFELDRLHIGKAEHLNYEWAIAAVVEFYRNHLPPEHWPIKVSIEKGLELDRNSLNLLGHIKKGRKFSSPNPRTSQA